MFCWLVYVFLFCLFLASKERAREEKEHDKERAKVNQSVYAATFDLEAVLYTPCSNVSQIFYKRKLFDKEVWLGPIKVTYLIKR
jgi:hypothetical protein